jgi:hypothetical protein
MPRDVSTALTTVCASTDTSQHHQTRQEPILRGSSGDSIMFSMSEARARFEERFPELQSKAKAYFDDYRPEAKDEAVANSLFLTWHHWVSLVKNGKADDTLLTSTIYYSCRQTRSGRMMKTVKASKFRDLFDHERRNGHAIVCGINLDAFVSERDTIPNIVAFKIDVPAWLDSLTENQRQRAMELAEGTSTKELAQRWNVSAPAVSFYRRQLNESYERFMNR